MAQTQKNGLEQRIIDTAREVFIEKGYAETSMSDIAATLNINRPTLHYYYRTKEKLFDAVFGEIIRNSVNLIHVTLARDEPIEERLSKIIDSYCAYFIEHPDLPLFFMREIQRDSEGLITEILESNVYHLFQEVSDLYDSYVEEGRIKNVPFVVFLMTFYSLLICPFTSRNLIMNPKVNEGMEFGKILESWKKLMLSQLDSLLEFRERNK